MYLSIYLHNYLYIYLPIYLSIYLNMLIFEYSRYESLNQLINEDYYYIGLCDSGNSVTHYTRCNYHDSDSYILAKTAIMTLDMRIQVCVFDIVLLQHTHKHVKKIQRWRGIFLVSCRFCFGGL